MNKRHVVPGGIRMILRSIAFAVGCLVVGSNGTYAADLTKIERDLRKTPAFKSKEPRYCLLVFGPAADYRVWLVLDGDTLYVDRNGDGDLSEAGESTGPESTNTDPCSFKPIKILAPDGQTEGELTFALFRWFDYREGRTGAGIRPSGGVWLKGRYFGSWGDETGPCVWGNKPAEAPILHVDGPLQMGFETAGALRSTLSGEFELSVGVGTKGIG